MNIQYALGNKWRIQAGMYYAWAFSRSNTGTATGIVGRTDIPDPNTVSNQEYNYSNNLNSHFYGITGGGQYHLSPSFAIDLRMTYSFKSLYKEAWEGVPYTLKDLYVEATVKYYFLKPGTQH
ncbi:MAG: outer membrane beta-barrel protein [Cytophagales bacterium]|nr:outer membrane beta-barrel protein [Cytophaga sp.]